ncbi:MAG: hypothetical protein WAT58_10955 [Candidatus Dormiibacterota bacterium]
MRALVVVPSALMILVGGVFTGQGFGYIPGSFMTGSLFWGITGLVLVVGGLALLVFAARRGSPD